MIYDVEQYIDYDRIKEILDKNINKKIICFGGGTASEILTKNLLYQYDVECYLDNNNELWNSNINNIPIKNPEILKDMKKDSFIVLILSKYMNDISNQLIQYGLIKDKDFFNIYEKFIKYFRVKKFDEITQKFIKFLDTIPNNIFDNIKVKSNPKIGVVSIATITDIQTWYPFAEFLLLKYKGYNVTLIMDNLKGFDDLTYFEDHHIITKKYCDYVIEYMKKKFSDLDIDYIDKDNQDEIDNNDIEEIKRLCSLNIKWYNSKKDDNKYIDDETKEVLFKELLINNLKCIKYYFKNTKFDTINVISALHKHRGLYMWEGLKNNIRVSNYDGAGTDGKTLYATNYPNGYHYDIPKLIKENFFNEKEEEWIISKSKEHFYNRRYSISDGKTMYNYQLVVNKNNKNNKWYDIIIPLNVMWDAGAIGLNKIFSTEDEWIIETINFILKNTDANIMIREHPAQMRLKDYINDNYYELIYKHFEKESQRVKIFRYFEKINTYEYIENCKLVLPLSSTVGIEAILLNKPIITHSNCYYSKLSFSISPSNKEEYFQSIIEALNNNIELNDYIKKEAWITYYLLMESRIKTTFSETNFKWLDFSFNQLLNDRSIEAILDVIVNDTPIPYYNIMQNIYGNNYKQ